MLDRKPELFRQKSIKRKPEPSKLANQQLNRLWRTIGRMLVCWKEGYCWWTLLGLVEAMWCVTPIRSFPVRHILNTRHLRWGIIAACRQVTTSLGPSDCAFRLKKTRRLFGVVIAAVWDKSFLPRCRCERETSKEPKTIRPALCSFVFFSSD